MRVSYLVMETWNDCNLHEKARTAFEIIEARSLAVPQPWRCSTPLISLWYVQCTVDILYLYFWVCVPYLFAYYRDIDGICFLDYVLLLSFSLQFVFLFSPKPAMVHIHLPVRHRLQYMVILSPFVTSCPLPIYQRNTMIRPISWRFSTYVKTCVVALF